MAPPFVPTVVRWQAMIVRRFCRWKILFVQKSADDVSNFDREFTSEEPILTPAKDPRPIRDEDQDNFSTFDYVNQWWFDGQSTILLLRVKLNKDTVQTFHVRWNHKFLFISFCSCKYLCQRFLSFCLFSSLLIDRVQILVPWTRCFSRSSPRMFFFADDSPSTFHNSFLATNYFHRIPPSRLSSAMPLALSFPWTDNPVQLFSPDQSFF